MDSDHVFVLFLGLALVGAAVSIAFASPTLFGGESDGITDASLASFETTEPYCGDPNTTTGSTLTRDVTGGQALVINETIPVASNETEVTAEFDTIGTQRYILEISRETPEPTATPTATPTPTPTPMPTQTADNRTTANATTTNQEPVTGTNGTATAASNGTVTEGTEQGAEMNRTTATPTSTETATECYLEVGYNASIALANPDDYTVLVTYDGELVGAYWREGEDSGSFDRVPERPDPTETANGTAMNGTSLRRPEP